MISSVEDPAYQGRMINKSNDKQSAPETSNPETDQQF